MITFGKMNEHGEISNIKLMKQSDLTSECWMIQFQGLDACTKCEFLNTDECGGKRIRKKLMKEK